MIQVLTLLVVLLIVGCSSTKEKGISVDDIRERASDAYDALEKEID